MLRMFKCNFLLRELCLRSSNQLLRFNSSPFLSCPTSVKTFWVSAVNFLDSFLPFSIPLPSSDVCQSMPSLLLTSFQSILSALLAVWLSFYSSLCCENPLTHSTTLPGSAPIQPSSRLNPTPAVFGSQAPRVASPPCGYFRLEPYRHLAKERIFFILEVYFPKILLLAFHYYSLDHWSLLDFWLKLILFCLAFLF